MGIFNKLLRAGEKAEALRTTEGSAIDRLASNKLMTGRQAIGKYATDAGSWAIAGGVLGSFAPVNPMGGGDSFGGATSGAMAGAMIGGIAGGRTLLKNMAKGRIVGSEAVDALASGVKNYKPRTINTFKDLAQDRTRSVTEGYKINSLARRGGGDYEAGLASFNSNKAAARAERQAYNSFVGPRPSPDFNSKGGTNAQKANDIIDRRGSGIDRIGKSDLRIRKAVENKRVDAQLKTMYKNIERGEKRSSQMLSMNNKRKSGMRRSQEDMAYGNLSTATFGGATGMTGSYMRGTTTFDGVSPIKGKNGKSTLRASKSQTGTGIR